MWVYVWSIQVYIYKQIHNTREHLTDISVRGSCVIRDQWNPASDSEVHWSRWKFFLISGDEHNETKTISIIPVGLHWQ